MKLPSLHRLAREMFATFKRFPFAILSAMVGTGATLIIIQHNFSSGPLYQPLYNICLVGFFGISLFIIAQLVGENKNWKFSSVLGINLSVLMLLAVYYLLLPSNIFENSSIHLIRFIFFVVAAHLFVAVCPFLDHGNVHEFWDFNKAIFLRLLMAAFYTQVLFVGLAIALSAIEHLFTIDIQPRRFMQLWWFLAGIFNTWFFLSGIPKKDVSWDGALRYPKGLKIFTQYVLIPLIVVYLIILYAYTIKIMVEWDWPKGWVGYLVLGFSITGIFSLLLIHPIKEQPENKWIAILWRWFFIVLLPLVVLLLLAIWRRISEYGLTENRYIVVVLGLWLSVISLYYIISRTKSIKLIPLSLGILSLAVSFGPWGAFSVSERDQLNRLEEVLKKNNILVNGKVERAKQGISFEDAKRISSVISYLSEVHGFDDIRPWFRENVDTIINTRQMGRWNINQENSKRIVHLLGVQYVSEREMQSVAFRRKEYKFRAESSNAVEIFPYKYMVNEMTLTSSEPTKAIHLDKELWEMTLHWDSASLSIVPSQNRSAHFSVDLREFSSRLFRQTGIQEYMDNRLPQDSMVLTKTFGNVRMMLCFTQYSLTVDSLGTRPKSATMNILMSTKRE
jgi:hypothetical protein